MENGKKEAKVQSADEMDGEEQVQVVSSNGSSGK